MFEYKKQSIHLDRLLLLYWMLSMCYTVLGCVCFSSFRITLIRNRIAHIHHTEWQRTFNGFHVYVYQQWGFFYVCVFAVHDVALAALSVRSFSLHTLRPMMSGYCCCWFFTAAIPRKMHPKHASPLDIPRDSQTHAEETKLSECITKNETIGIGISLRRVCYK